MSTNKTITMNIAGKTLEGLCNEYNTSVEELCKLNAENIIYVTKEVTRNVDYTINSLDPLFTLSGNTLSVKKLSIPWDDVPKYLRDTPKFKGWESKTVPERTWESLLNINPTSNYLSPAGILYDVLTNKFYNVISSSISIIDSNDSGSKGGRINLEQLTLVLKEISSTVQKQVASKTVSDFLKELTPQTRILPEINAILPEKSSGGVTVSLKALPKQSPIVKESASPYARNIYDGNFLSSFFSYFGDTSNSSQYNTLYDSLSYVILYERNSPIGSMYLPVFPDEVTDSNGVNFSPTNILGRSVSYQTYSSSSRDVNFSLELHEEIVPQSYPSYDYVRNLVAFIQSAEYPEYASGQVNPYEIEFVIGTHIKIRGILKNCGATWKKPLIDGKLVHCVLNISVTETTGPYSSSEIRNVGAYR